MKIKTKTKNGTGNTEGRGMPARLPRQRPRTCVACHSESPKRALVRVVRTPAGDAVLDVTGKLPGRGAYICLNAGCFEKARKSGALSRALKTPLTEACWEELERCVRHYTEGRSPEEISKELRSLVGLSRRAGQLIIGTDALQSASRAGRDPLLLMTARDCSESVQKIIQKIMNRDDDVRIRHESLVLPMDIESLSAALGAAGGVQAIGLPLRSGLSDKIKILTENLKV